eukprot:1093577-Rhodomonas_salina.2
MSQPECGAAAQALCCFSLTAPDLALSKPILRLRGSPATSLMLPVAPLSAAPTQTCSESLTSPFLRWLPPDPRDLPS